ncbi:hypothetical protein K438DRAFT_2056146 [Mycena galopus ATCC 62051]|nr:hypothetical protein K438DRAFT_2056146 [Mycena galopus ATCC 62051]
MPPKSKSKPKTKVTRPTTIQDQCLGNPDLLDQILRFVPNDKDMCLTRTSLYSAVLSSRAFYHSAVKVLWQRLDNLLPLLHLLPTFKESGSHYYLPGLIADTDWEVFDRYAAYVKEIVYKRTRGGIADALVYMRLAMHNAIPLPNLSRYECASDRPGPDLILFISPSLASLRLEASLASDTETFLNMLSAVAPRLSDLALANYPNTMLLSCALFRQLQQVDLASLHGPVTNPAFNALASLPLLQSLTTDLTGWDKIDFQSIGHGSIFCALKHLTMSAPKNLLGRTIPLLLPRIGSTSMVSIIVVDSDPHYSAWETSHGSVETFTAVTQCIASCWPTTLSHLQIEGVACSAEDFATLQGASKIKTLELRKTLQGSLSDSRVLSVFRTWSELTSLTINGADADIELMTCLAHHCTALRFLHLSFFPHPLPEISTTPVLAHALAELRFFRNNYDHSWNRVDLHVLARHLDRLFPEVAKIVGEGSHQRWKDVATLVLMFQDVRRTAWEQRAQVGVSWVTSFIRS